MCSRKNSLSLCNIIYTLLYILFVLILQSVTKKDNMVLNSIFHGEYHWCWNARDFEESSGICHPLVLAFEV